MTSLLDLLAGESPVTPAPAADVDDLDAAGMAALLATRPRTRGDCLPGGINEQRPCPFASCKFHLLAEETTPNGDHRTAGYTAGGQYRRDAIARPQPSLTLNRARRGAPLPVGRPPTLAPDASKREVAAFVDAAVAQLEVMPETCALDVAARGGLHQEQVAAILGLSCEAIIESEDYGMAQWRGKSYNAGMAPPKTVARTLRRGDGESAESAIARAREWAWWSRVADEQPESAEGRWTWQVYEMVDAKEGLRLAAEQAGKDER